MFRLTLLFSLLLAGCMGSDDSSPNNGGGIESGVYQAKIEFLGSPLGRGMTLEFNAKSDGTFVQKVFYTYNFGALVNFDYTATGKWTSTSTKIIYKDQLESFADSLGNFSTPQPIPNDTDVVRNVSKNGWELYAEPGGQPALWVTFLKI